MNTQPNFVSERSRLKTHEQNLVKNRIPKRKSRIKSKQNRTIAINDQKITSLARFLVFTGVIFGFGGLGFGLGIRFGQDFQLYSNSINSSILEHLTLHNP
jgi:hypothetical protein